MAATQSGETGRAGYGTVHKAGCRTGWDVDSIEDVYLAPCVKLPKV